MSNFPVSHIVVHYSASQRGQDVTAAQIDKMHKARGWRGIGYHYVIRLDGKVEKGRDERVVGAHVGGKNTGSIGICWVGGVDGDPNIGVDTRTPAQTQALIKLIKELLTRYPNAKVVGHRDLASTQCPGFDVIPWWASVQKSLNVPAKTPNVTEGDFYIVQRGDSLSKIAQAFDTSVDALRRVNALTSDTIVVGQHLRLPRAPVVPAPVPNNRPVQEVPSSQDEGGSLVGFLRWLLGCRCNH